MKAYKKKGLDDNINKVQDNVQLALNPIINSPIINGILLSNITLTSGQDNIIEHKLGRELRGYLVVKKSANSNIWDLQDINKLSRLTLNLQCSTNCVISLWVF
jgi:hypothetical protein